MQRKFYVKTDSTSRPSSALFERACVHNVRLLVARAHELGVLYADDDWAPLSDITFALLLERAGVRWRYCAMEGLAEIIWPPVCGIHVMHLAKGQPYAERRFAMRHGLAHVLAGHAMDRVWRQDGPSMEESVADLFALADLMPDRELAGVVDGGTLSEPMLQAYLMARVLEYAPSWEPAKVLDRVSLRWALWLAG